jgi:glycine/D-amino acid oxidase-like deaminating enzyme
MFEAVDEIGRVAAAEAIEADYRKAGMLLFATSPAQEARLADHVADLRRWGYGAEDLVVLGPGEARARAAVAGARAAMFTPHCAAVHPWRLVAGLAAAVERRGGVIYEHSPVRTLGPGLVVADEGAVRAPVVLRCTEAFTASLPGSARLLAPIYSLMIATEPMPGEWWEEVGLHHGETFSDERHLIVYGQRTADGRLAFGGRGAPYHFGSTVRPGWDTDLRTHEKVGEVLWELFPQLGDARVTHRWGGAVAVPRDWRVSVDFDPVTGQGHAGGYVGQGVTGANLAGRTLADLVAGSDTERTSLPFVGHRWRRWEPEPLRWVGINLGRALAPLADAAEGRRGRPARLLGGVLSRLTGG